MKRKCIFLESSQKTFNKDLYVDEENAESMLDFLTKNERFKKKFKYIIYIILNENPTKDIFGHEKISEATKDVYAIKLFKGRENARIYCKVYDLESDGYHIVMAELLESKKSQGISKKIRKLIEKVGSYEYEIEE